MSEETGSETSKFVGLFREEYAGRPTRIGLFEGRPGALTDYWIESGLPLEEISVSEEAKSQVFRIRAGRYTHTIADPTRISFHFSPGGDEDGVDVAQADGRTFVVRFEKR